MSNSEVQAYVDNLKQINNDPFPKVKVVPLDGGNIMIQGKPYARSNVQNARTAKNRPVISIEAGFEANNAMSNAIAYLFTDYIMNACKGPNCVFDYFVFPAIAGQDAVDYATSTNNSWVKTRNANAGSGCVGTNLLENFKHGDWANGNADPCSDLYRGSAEGSAPQGNYQMQKMAKKKDIRLSVTLTKNGGKLSYPPAFSTTDVIAETAKYGGLLEAYNTGAATSYSIGSYANQHGVSHGHPLDFNYKEYKDSGYAINVGLGGKSGAEIKTTFDNFVAGINSVIDEWKKSENFKMEFY